MTRKTEIIDGTSYRVIERMGFNHDIGAHAIMVETPDGEKVAMRHTGGVWRFRTTMEEQSAYDVEDRPTCETCRWWGYARPRTTGEGECHRYPPRPGRVVAVIYPQTYESDWCGEHTVKEGDDGD